MITYGMNYDGTPITDHLVQTGMDQPVRYWTPSIAASPLTFYTGTRFPQWKNNLLLGSLATQELLRLEITGNKMTRQEILFKGIGRVRDIVNGPDGELYVCSTHSPRYSDVGRHVSCRCSIADQISAALE